MRDAVAQRAIWAMHPAALAELLQRDAIEGAMPEGVRNFFGIAQSGGSEAKVPDPVREGSTLVLPLSGALSPTGIYWGGTSTEKFAERLREAGADDRVGAIILKVMSPGGLVWGTQEAGDAVFEVRQSKPVIAVADKYSFSAAHWIASQATAYYATPSGQVGSVGVRGGHVDMSGFEDKIGMKTTLIASSEKKIAAHPYAPLSDDDRAEMQAEIDEMAEAFAAAIARGRGIKASEVADIHGTGEIFSASRAAERGAIDGVMSLRDVIAKYGTSRARLDLMRKKAQLQGQRASI